MKLKTTKTQNPTDFYVNYFCLYKKAKTIGLKPEDIPINTKENIANLVRWLKDPGGLASEFGNKTVSNVILNHIISHAFYRDFDVDYIEMYRRILMHPKKTENIDYLTVCMGKTRADAYMKRKSERVLGKNNPGFQHGGKLSPFSKKFVSYANMSEAEKETVVKKKFDDRTETMRENPHLNSTRIEYYLARGMTQDEAAVALSERQTTFSLDICKEKYGEVEGERIWLARQIKWMNTLYSKGDEAIFDMNKRKARRFSSTAMDSYGSDYPAKFYIYKVKDCIKIGCTIDDVRSRILNTYDVETLKNIEILAEFSTTASDAFRLEQLIRYANFDKTISKELYEKLDLNHPSELFMPEYADDILKSYYNFMGMSADERLKLFDSIDRR